MAKRNKETAKPVVNVENTSTTESTSTAPKVEAATENKSVVDENLEIANEIAAEGENTPDMRGLAAPKAKKETKAPKTEKQVLKTSKEWQASNECKYIIIQHSGWDRSKFEFSFNEEKITIEEFNSRIEKSSVRPK